MEAAALAWPAMTVGVREIAPGLWRWAARHPDWHPGVFGSEVASYALRVRDHGVLLNVLSVAQRGLVPRDGACRTDLCGATCCWIDR